MEHINDLVFEKAKSGYEPAFERLVDHYGKLAFNVAYRMLGNADDAKDISQEAWLKAYANIARCKNAAMFKPWLCKIVNNTCIDFLRKKKSRPHTDSLDDIFTNQDGDYEVTLEDTNSPNPEAILLENEEKHALNTAVNRLTPAHKMMIIYRDIHGFSYEEISEITNQNIGTVKSQIARAREALRKILVGEK